MILKIKIKNQRNLKILIKQLNSFIKIGDKINLKNLILIFIKFKILNYHKILDLGRCYLTLLLENHTALMI